MSRITLTRFLIERQRNKQLINADLRLLIETIARACKAISNAVTKGSIAGNLGSAGSDNVQGEAQKKLDVLSNEILLEANEWGGNLAALASEEMEDPHPIPTHFPKGEYLLLVDGGVLNNLPGDVMRSLGGGWVIAVDVSLDRDLEMREAALPSPW